MKIKYVVFAIYFLLCINSFCYSQKGTNWGEKQFGLNKSILFGKDIIISDHSLQDQKNLSICSAFNGWLYAGYTYHPAFGKDSIVIKISRDCGITWDDYIFFSAPFFDETIEKMRITACGYTLSEMKFFIGIFRMLPNKIGKLSLYRFQGESGTFEAQIAPNPNDLRDFEIQCDCEFPAINSNPFSLALLYADENISSGDHLKLMTSNDGGMSLDLSTVRYVTSSVKYHSNLSLSYGRSSTQNEGRYFVSWQETIAETSTLGHIYTAHTEPYFNSLFTQPVSLDSLDITDIMNCRHTSISCQVNNIENDSSNITTLVLTDRLVPSTQTYNIIGYYNLNSVGTNNFHRFSLTTDTTMNRIIPAATFNPYDSTFMVTYFDSTQKQIPLLVNSFNFQNPNSWVLKNQKVNDSTNLETPYPIVIKNPISQDAAFGWVENRDNGNHVALFDYENSTYTAISSEKLEDNETRFWTYPNPVYSIVNLELEIKTEQFVDISLYTIDGQYISNIVSQNYLKGKYFIKTDFSKYPIGNYLAVCKSINSLIYRKIVIVR